MFNCWVNVYSWYEIFVSLDCSFAFLFLLMYSFILISFSKNNMQFFVNICVVLVLLTIFLFYHNAGAYAGFLFLCEIVSLFTIFIILNKIKCDEFVILKRNNVQIFFISVFVLVFVFCLLKAFVNQSLITTESIYCFLGVSTNDFIAINQLFYSNKYNIYLYISIFLIVYSGYIILYFLYVNDLYHNKDSILLKDYVLYGSIRRLFSENNVLHFKNRICINYFKKYV